MLHRVGSRFNRVSCGVAYSFGKGFASADLLQFSESSNFLQANPEQSLALRLEVSKLGPDRKFVAIPIGLYRALDLIIRILNQALIQNGICRYGLQLVKIGSGDREGDQDQKNPK